jgi:uncharacterized membrane protein YfcA
MPALDSTDLFLAAVALVAALVNGGLGYGFSSITVPLALWVLPNRVLSPALVLVEVFINLVALGVNARGVPAVARRMVPLLVGLVPGAALGTYALAQTGHGALRLSTYAILLPLILLQTAGWRWPIRREALAGVPLGAGVGLLYAATTISGPPLALLLNNQGFAKEEFRAGLSLFRVVEALVTALLYASAGLFTAESVHVSGVVVPSILLGMPLGFTLLRRLPTETFRRVCMAVDASLVGLGLSKAATEQGLVSATSAQVALVGILALEAALLWRYFRGPRPAPALVAAAEGRP